MAVEVFLTRVNGGAEVKLWLRFRFMRSFWVSDPGATGVVVELL